MTHTTGRQYTFGGRTYDLSSRTHLMGILNVTPDSFSDGGRFATTAAAVEAALAMVQDGADFIDVGGESSRPGARPVSVADEISRVVPVIRELTKRSNVPVSIDTTKAEVATEALKAGAVIVNDISGLRNDPRIAPVASLYRASLIVMHMRGSPRTMQDDPRYDDLLGEIRAMLMKSVEEARSHGISQIMVDPGIGFGKSVDHNLQILKHLKTFTTLGCPLLVGPSRKSFIGRVLDLPVESRLEGTAAAVAVSIMNGAHIVRVHDILQMKRVAGIVDAVLRSSLRNHDEKSDGTV